MATQHRHASVRGFTLIEMMVVMVLLGLVSALTLPSMQRWHDAVQARAQVALVVEALRGSMFSAASRRQDVAVTLDSFAPPAPAASAAAVGGTTDGTAESARITLPAGWVVERVVDAMFMKNGLCRPGLALLRNPGGQRVVVQISGPACSIDTLTDVPAGMR